MSAKVWMSSVLSNNELGNKLGTRTKYYGNEWNPASFDIPAEPEEVYQASRRHVQGFSLKRSEFPEAQAVFDEKRFSKVPDIFFSGGFLAIKGKLADLFSHFELGTGGLVPFPIYSSDLTTPYEGEFYFLNFGARKNSLLPGGCEDARKFYVDKNTGQQVWKLNSLNPDAEVLLSASALEGADLWFDEAVHNKIFMTDELAQALIGAGLAGVFKLKECQVEGDSSRTNNSAGSVRISENAA
jgi:hypothetical protein